MIWAPQCKAETVTTSTFRDANIATEVFSRMKIFILGDNPLGYWWGPIIWQNQHQCIQRLCEVLSEDKPRDLSRWWAVAYPCSLQWRHNGRDGVSNHQPHHCLLNRLFGRRSKKASNLRVTGLCAGNSPGTGEFPAQMASNAENVSIWWRHHVNWKILGLSWVQDIIFSNNMGEIHMTIFGSLQTQFH